MLDRVEQYQWGEQWPIVKNTRQQLDKAKEAKQKVIESKQSLHLYTFTVPFGQIFDLPEFRDTTNNIYVCAICKNFFDMANEWRDINF